jgi:hypothetical protein
MLRPIIKCRSAEEVARAPRTLKQCVSDVARLRSSGKQSLDSECTLDASECFPILSPLFLGTHVWSSGKNARCGQRLLRPRTPLVRRARQLPRRTSNKGTTVCLMRGSRTHTRLVRAFPKNCQHRNWAMTDTHPYYRAPLALALLALVSGIALLVGGGPQKETTTTVSEQTTTNVPPPVSTTTATQTHQILP